jgi:hypothetical protein
MLTPTEHQPSSFQEVGAPSVEDRLFLPLLPPGPALLPPPPGFCLSHGNVGDFGGTSGQAVPGTSPLRTERPPGHYADLCSHVQQGHS